MGNRVEKILNSSWRVESLQHAKLWERLQTCLHGGQYTTPSTAAVDIARLEFMTFSIPDLTAQLRTLGVDPGGVLLVHMSYRAVRPVEARTEGVIDALLAAVGGAGTVVDAVVDRRRRRGV
jgi:hypothetical protein